MFDKFKTRKGRLENKIKTEMEKDSPSLDTIVSAVDTYEKDNTDTIEKLKKDKKADMNRINGALKQTINAHGPITKQLIGSAGKRIYGSLILNPNHQEKKPTKFSISSILLGVALGMGVTILFTLMFL